LQSTLTQTNEVVTHLQDYWYQESVANQEKKDLLRCVIKHVLQEKQVNVRVDFRAEVCWQGGATTIVEVPKYLFSAPHLFHRIAELACELPDAQIAEALNAQGLETAKGRAWLARRVMDFRLSNGIPSGFTVNPQLRVTENGYLTSTEAAARLEINQTTVQKWYKLGLLSGKHAGEQKALWIEWTAEARHSVILHGREEKQR